MSITVQDASRTQGLAAESAYGTDMSFGIMRLPDKNHLITDDATLRANNGNFNIKHKCTFAQDWQRTFTHVDTDANTRMQFTISSNVGNFAGDVWHWNSEKELYYRPDYTYCDDVGYNPGPDIQAIFWIREYP